MSQQSSQSDVVNALPESEDIGALQERLDTAGIDCNLQEVVADTFRTAIKTLLEKPAGELTADEIRAITAEVRSTSASLDVRPHQQFEYQATETELGIKATFTVKAGQSLRSPLGAASESYDQHASEEQKGKIVKLVYDGELKQDDLLDTVADEDTTYTLTILRGGANKSRVEVMDTETGEIKIADDMTATERAVLTVAAALHIDQSVSEGILVTPGEKQGDLLEGNIVRARSGAVSLFIGGLDACYVSDAYRSKDVVAAGSPSRN